MSVAAPLPATEEPKLMNGPSASSPTPQQKKGEGKYSMMASAPPMEPPPLDNQGYVAQTLEGDQLKETLTSLVDYFLSRSYLEGDPYMVSQMNADRFLPVNLIVDKISFLVGPVETEDVVNTISASKDLKLDESKTFVRPNIKLTRNTVILRELPGITPEEVKGLFAKDESLPVPTEVTKEIGENWFVSFETEDQALKALPFIRKQTYNGVAVAARLKQESLSRSSYAFDPVAMPYFNPTPKGDNNDLTAHSHTHWDPSSDAHRAGHDSKDHRRRFDRKNRAPRRGRDYNAQGGNASGNASGTGNANGGNGGNPGNSGNTGNNSNAGGNVSGNGGNESGQGRHGYGHRNRRGHGGGQGRKRVNSGKRGAPASINLGLAHFPPLNAQEKSQGQKVSQHIKKLSKSDIVAVIKALGEPHRPIEMPAECIAVSASPNISLEVAKPMPKVETVELQAKPKQVPDYKAVLSAKPVANQTPQQQQAPKAENAGKGGKNQSGKGRKEDGKGEDGEGKKGKKNNNTDEHAGPKGKHNKKGRGGKGGEGKGKGGANKEKEVNKEASQEASASEGASESSAGSNESASGDVKPQSEKPASPKDGEKKKDDGARNPMSWASRISKPSSPTPAAAAPAAAPAANSSPPPAAKETEPQALSTSQ